MPPQEAVKTTSHMNCLDTRIKRQYIKTQRYVVKILVIKQKSKNDWTVLGDDAGEFRSLHGKDWVMLGFHANWQGHQKRYFWWKSTLLTSNYNMQPAFCSVFEEGEFWLSMCEGQSWITAMPKYRFFLRTVASFPWLQCVRHGS